MGSCDGRGGGVLALAVGDGVGGRGAVEGLAVVLARFNSELAFGDVFGRYGGGSLLAGGLETGDGEGFGLFADVASFSLEGVFDVEGQVEVADVD